MLEIKAIVDNEFLIHNIKKLLIFGENMINWIV